jgi:cytidyltransferase-like protein
MKGFLKLSFCVVCFFTSIICAEELDKRIVVYADVSGDMFHAGHVEFFKKAKAFGNYLIIGVLADDVIEGYKRCPVLSLEERVKVIEACKYVDEVIVAPPLNLSKEVMQKLQISYVVHGDDFSPELIQDQYGDAIEMGIFRTVPYTPGISTTNIISRITERYSKGEFGGGEKLLTDSSE